MNTIPDLTKTLSELTYTDLFQRPDKKTLDTIWRSNESFYLLERIICNKSIDCRVRFLAAEILFSKVPDYPPENARNILANIYASALSFNYTINANPWGLPGFNDGETADHVIRIGEAAIPALKMLLDNNNIVTYSGSKEATYSNKFKYRIKDIAISLIARIRNHIYLPEEKPEMRDLIINHLDFL